MKYNVAVEFLYHADVEIEAESVEEAVEMAKNMRNDEIVGSEVVAASDLEDGQLTSIYDENWDCVWDG